MGGYTVNSAVNNEQLKTIILTELSSFVYLSLSLMQSCQKVLKLTAALSK